MKKYMAYVGSYTNYGKSKGIAIFDVDVEKGVLTKREEVGVNNCAALCISKNKKFLYAVVDEGVEAFKIQKDGSLELLNIGSIRGMRGCSIVVDSQNKFIVVGGYHDSKLTVLSVNPDGSVGHITASYFEQGYGSVVEGNFSPHISSVCFTPDEKYVCAVVSGLDHIKVFQLDKRDGTLNFSDVVRCELDSQPRIASFGPDGQHLYVMSQKKSYVATFNYEDLGNRPNFGFKQLVSTQPKKTPSVFSAACALQVCNNGKHVWVANAGDNTVAMFERDEENGLLYQKFVLPISGDFPKDLCILPGDEYILCINHVSNSITCFKVNYEGNYLVMNGRLISQDYPNCCEILELAD